MLRVRFFVNSKDPRPINWPIKHPYWITGTAGDDSYHILVSYADDLDYIKDNWPEAKIDSAEEVDDYVFTSRFPKPDWFNEGEGIAFDDINSQLGNGWVASAISTVTGKYRVQLHDNGIYADIGFRTGQEGDTLEEAVNAAVKFSKSTTPDEYFASWGGE